MMRPGGAQTGHSHETSAAFTRGRFELTAVPRGSALAAHPMMGNGLESNLNNLKQPANRILF